MTVELINVYNFFQSIWAGTLTPLIVLLGLSLGGLLVRLSRKQILPNPDPQGPSAPPTSDPPLENPPPNPGFDPN